MKLSLKGVLLTVLLFFFTDYTSMCMDEGDPRRNWRGSLKLHHDEHIFFDGDAWLVENNQFIQNSVVKRLLKSINKKSKYLPNIAKASFTIIFSYHDKILSSTFDLEQIFFSGQLDFAANTSVISAQTFQKKNDLNNSQYNAVRKHKMEELFHIELVTATCAEASILEYVYNHIPEYINHIKHDKEDNVIILGTILQVSSLKDPCSQNCIPMFEQFMPYIHTILSSKIADMHGISLAPALENIILLAGREKHANSRENYHEINAPINLDFQNPSNRIYSKNNE